MATAWGGADPVEQADPNDYELACEYIANADITITDVRIWTGATEVNVTNRRARIWTVAGAQLGIATLPDNLATGWSTHALDAVVTRLAGERFVVSYSTGGTGYGALVDALDNAVNSADTNVTARKFSDAQNGNGCFNATPGTFPVTGSGAHAFYGADCVYTVGIGGNTAPRITGVTAAASGATVTVVASAVDDETLVGATYHYEWGDGNTTTSASNTVTHTYTASGTYGVLVSVTDASGASDYAAVGVDVLVPPVASTLLQAARETLTAVLVALSIPDVTVLGFEPPALARGTTVTVSSAGMEPTEYVLAVRVYVNGIQAAEAQDVLDRTVVQVDAGLTHVPRTDWDFEWDDARNAFVASTTVQYAREDF
jgi:hypothetical protein